MRGGFSNEAFIRLGLDVKSCRNTMIISAFIYGKALSLLPMPIKSVDNIAFLPILMSYFLVFTSKSPNQYQITCRWKRK
jgi:hypothetical protein